MSNPVGRPSKYNDALQAEADSYLGRLQELGHVVPSRAGLCCFLGIARDTSYQWEKIHPAFSGTLRAIDVMQEHLTLNGGLAGAFNPTIAKLILSNNHGYSETNRVDHSNSDGSLNPTRIIIQAADVQRDD